MDPKHKEVLRILRQNILDNASDVEGLVDHLYSRDVLTDYHKDCILVENSRKSQLKVLLDILKTRGKLAFRHFVECLKICKDDDLAADLAKAGHVNLTEQIPQSEAQPKEIEKKYDDWPKEEHCGLSVNVVKCKKEEVHDQLSAEDIYSITKHKKKGLLWVMDPYPKTGNKLMVEHTKFQSTMKTILTGMSVDTGLFTKLKAEDIIKKFTDELKKFELEDCGCFVFVTVTCGPDSSKVYDIEGQEVDLSKIFEEMRNCPGLKDKPKLVIIHTYQVPEKMSPNFFETDTLPAVSTSGQEQSESDATGYPSEDISAASIGGPTDSTQENDDDFFVVYTKYKKGSCILDKNQTLRGTWFLQCFSYVMANYSNSLSFMDIIDKVNLQLQHAIVGEGKTEDVAEVVYLHKCSKKRLFFFPGIEAKHVTSPTDQ